MDFTRHNLPRTFDFYSQTDKREFGGTVWHGYVPGLNAISYFENEWKALVLGTIPLVPGVNLIMLTIMHVELGIVFGKPTTKTNT